MDTYFYKGLDLRKATQFDLAEILQLPILLVSTENGISEEKNRISELFIFSEYHNLSELIGQLKAIYPQ